MNTGIPRRLYAHIERRLYERDYAEVAKASLSAACSREDALSLKSPSLDVKGRGGQVSDRVQQGVERVIEAEERLSRAIRWQMVYARLDEAFAGSAEGEVAQMIYRDKVTSQQIANLRGCAQQTIRRMRDT